MTPSSEMNSVTTTLPMSASFVSCLAVTTAERAGSHRHAHVSIQPTGWISKGETRPSPSREGRACARSGSLSAMPRSFRRIDAVPPYAFAAVDALKQELRREGRDVVDLGFGNPDIASPTIAVEKLREAAGKARNHRYSASRGIPKLREAICDLYRRRFGVELDPETQALTTIGAKEGLTHLMWVLLEPGDTAVVPTPSYPIHQFAPFFAGAAVALAPVAGG